MKYTVSSIQHKQEFQKNGFLHVENFFDSELCLSICDELRNLDQNLVNSVLFSGSTFIKKSQSFPSLFHGLTYLQKGSLFVNNISRVKNLALLSFASQLLSVDDVFFSEDEVHVRQPSSGHEIPAHQDNFYFGFEIPIALTCYVYLTHQDRSSGGLGFLAANTQSFTDDHDPSSTLGFSSYNKSIETKCKDDFFYPSTSPGDVVFHHSTTYHRAYENLSPDPTASLSIRVFSSSNLAKSPLLQKKYLSNLSSNRA